MEHLREVWPLELGLLTRKLRRGPLSWGFGLRCYGVAPGVGVMESHALVWPLELGVMEPCFSVWPLDLGLGTRTLWCGPSSWGCDSPASVWSVELGLKTFTLRRGPSIWG